MAYSQKTQIRMINEEDERNSTWKKSYDTSLSALGGLKNIPKRKITSNKDLLED